MSDGRETMVGTRLVRSKRTGLHLVVRPASEGSLHGALSPESFAPSFNSLVASKDLTGLLAAVDALPPLLPCENLGGSRRVYTPSQASAMLEGDKWRRADPVMLERETKFDWNKRGERRQRSVKSVLRRRDAFSGNWVSDLAKCTFKSDVVVAEPLSDWIFARNVLSLTSNLLASLGSRSDDALEAAGLSRTVSARLGASVFCAPIAFNPFFAQGAAMLIDYAETSPLLEALFERDEPKLGLGPVRWRAGGGKKVYATTAAVATGEGHKLLAPRSEAPDQRLHLCVEDDGGNQESLAAECAESLALAVSALVGDGGEALGWTFDGRSIVDGSPGPSMMRHSLLAELMYRLVYREALGLALTACRQCGNAVLDGARGNKRHFCSPACRVRHAREHP